jgi:hypothetical protein
MYAADVRNRDHRPALGRRIGRVALPPDQCVGPDDGQQGSPNNQLSEPDQRESLQFAVTRLS